MASGRNWYLNTEIILKWCISICDTKLKIHNAQYAQSLDDLTLTDWHLSIFEFYPSASLCLLFILYISSLVEKNSIVSIWKIMPMQNFNTKNPRQRRYIIKASRQILAEHRKLQSRYPLLQNTVLCHASN